MLAHMKRVHTINSECFACKICNKTFTRRNLLQVHMSRHHEGKKKCTECKIEVYGLKRHMDQAHGGVHNQKFHCPKCNQSFAEEGRMKHHLICVHRNNKPFICQICKKSVKMMKCLKVHIDSHRPGSKLLTCNVLRKQIFFNA